MTRDGYTIKSENDLRDEQGANEARRFHTHTTPAELRMWTWAVDVATRDLAANARTLGVAS